MSGPSSNGNVGAALRIAAAGDIHCREARRAELRGAFAALRGSVDLVLLAGDLTTHGEPDEAGILVDCCGDLGGRTIAVLGNHDWHANRHEDLVSVLEGGGITVLERASIVR